MIETPRAAGLRTEVEVRFVADGERTRVELEHRELDRYGARRDEMRATFESEGGWPGLLEAYARAVRWACPRRGRRGFTLDTMRALLLGSLLLLACTRATPGGLARGAGGSGQEDPCGGAAVDPWGFCRGPGGEPLDLTCCPEPAPRPCRERVFRGCELDGLCRWLAPGCAEPALPAEGCYPIDDCTEGACAEGLACREVVVDPSVGKRCSTCDARARLCLPPGCADGASVIGGACLAPDGSAQPPACCTWPCRAGGLFCAAVPPRCPPGEVPAVWGGCWGPCIPPDRCEEGAEEVLCWTTGGAWDAGGCGNADCGNARACDPPVPGCVCPIDSAFVDGVGCEPSDACGP